MEGSGHSPSPLPAASASQRERDALPERGGRSERAATTADPEPGQALWPLRNPGPDAPRTCPSSGSGRHPCPPALASLSAFRAQGPRWLPQLQAPSREPPRARALSPRGRPLAPKVPGGSLGLRQHRRRQALANCCDFKRSLASKSKRPQGTALDTRNRQAPANPGPGSPQCPLALVASGGFCSSASGCSHITELHSCSKSRLAPPRRLQPQAASSAPNSREHQTLASSGN